MGRVADVAQKNIVHVLRHRTPALLLNLSLDSSDESERRDAGNSHLEFVLREVARKSKESGHTFDFWHGRFFVPRVARSFWPTWLLMHPSLGSDLKSFRHMWNTYSCLTLLCLICVMLGGYGE